MKTYLLEEQFGDTIRVTVEDDTQVSCSSYEGDREGMLVIFNKPTAKYDTETIAAFGRIARVYLQGTKVEKHVATLNEEKVTEKQDRTYKWTPLGIDA